MAIQRLKDAAEKAKKERIKWSTSISKSHYHLLVWSDAGPVHFETLI